MPYYPDITESDVEVLRKARIIVENILQDPEYLNDKTCSYTPEAKLLLAGLILENTPNVAHEDKSASSIDPTNFSLLNTSLEVIKELTELKNSTSMKNLSTNERISTFRLLVTQLEKVTEIVRQAEEIDQYRLFKTVLFDTLERHLTPAQISEFVADFETEVNDRKRI